MVFSCIFYERGRLFASPGVVKKSSFEIANPLFAKRKFFNGSVRQLEVAPGRPVLSGFSFQGKTCSKIHKKEKNTKEEAKWQYPSIAVPMALRQAQYGRVAQAYAWHDHHNQLFG